MPRGKPGDSQAPNTLTAKPLLPPKPEANEATAHEVPVGQVAPCPRNLRGDDLWDDPNERDETIASLKALGLLQALVVVRLPAYLAEYPDHAAKFGPDVKYVIAAGHKRFDCIRDPQLKWEEVRIDVQDSLAPHLDEVFLDENLRRSGLNAFQEAEGYARLRSKLTDAEIAARYNIKSKSRVSKRVKILPLQGDPEARAAVVSGAMSPDMAHRLMVAVGDEPALVMPAFRLVKEERLDVKEAARRVLVAPSPAESAPVVPPQGGAVDEAPATGAGEAPAPEPTDQGGEPSPTSASDPAESAAAPPAGTEQTPAAPAPVTRGRNDVTDMERERTRAAARREEHCALLVKEYSEPSHVDDQTLHTARTAVAMVGSEPLRLAHQWLIAAGVSGAKAFKAESYRDNILSGDDKDLLLRFAYAATLADSETHSQDRRRVPDFRAIRHWQYLISTLGYEPGPYELQYL